MQTRRKSRSSAFGADGEIDGKGMFEICDKTRQYARGRRREPATKTTRDTLKILSNNRGKLTPRQEFVPSLNFTRISRAVLG